jgi:hypothetical protein
MRYRTIALFALMIGSASAAQAQTAPLEPAADAPKPTLQEQLMPDATTTLMAPASAEATKAIESTNETSAMMPRGAGTGLIIAGGALFIAGLIIGGDAGTVLAVGGAALGAYGLYQYFR